MSYIGDLENVRIGGVNMSAFVPILYSIARDFPNVKRRTVLEIGVRKGTSTLAWLCGLKDSKIPDVHLFSIDLQDCSWVCPPELKDMWTFIKGDSRTISWDKEIDILLIDGGHSYKTCLSDYERFEPFVRDGGIILMHDVSWQRKSPIKVFWDEVYYPKTILPLSPSGLGIIYKIQQPYYDDARIKFECEY